VASFDQALNTDVNNKLTSAIWDTDVGAWMIKNQNYVMNSAGTLWLPLGLDADGNLKASVKNSALPAGAATQATLAEILTQLIDGLPEGTNNIGDIDIATAIASATTTLQSAVSVSGDGTDFAIDGYGTVLLEVTGTFVASISILGSMDGSNFNTALRVQKIDTGTMLSTITEPGTYKVINPAGLQKLRTPVTWTSGTSVTVKGRAIPLSSNDNSFELTGSIPAGTNEIGKIQVTGSILSDGVARTLSSVATPDGATAQIWTPATGMKFRVLQLVVTASIAGTYTVVQKDTGTGTINQYIARFKLETNKPFVLTFPPQGVLSTIANDYLGIINGSGSASDILANTYGREE